MEKTIRTNKKIFLIQNTLSSICILVSTGTLFQTLLVTLGFSTRLIYVHSTVIQAVNVVALLLFARTDGERNIIKRYAFTGLPSGIILLCYLPFCFQSGASLKAFALILIIGIFQTVVSALRTGYCYTLPYLLYPAEDYGTINAIAGVLSGAISFFVGYIISTLTGSVPYIVLMAGAFCFCALLEFISIRLILIQKSILNNGIYRGEPAKDNPLSISQTLKHPSFLRLILPNILRGFAAGVTGILATVAFDLGFDETVTTAMATIYSVASLVGCMVFGILQKRISSRIILFLGSLSFVFLPVLFTQNKVIFLLTYALILFGRSWIDNGVPTLLRYVVPIEIAGPYNILRMLLHSGGTLLATSVATIVSSKALMLLALAASVISGIEYLRNT